MKNFGLVSLIKLLLLCLLLSACGELSYKRGATSADLENARKNCQQEQASVATETCLQNSGWTVQKLDSMEVFEEIVLKKPTEAPTSANAPVAEAVVTTPIANIAEKSTENINQVAAVEASPLKPTISPSDPLDTFVVSAWWKFGASADRFRADSNSCVSTLGEAHKPNASTQTATAGFIVCMREKGWKATKKPKN